MTTDQATTFPIGTKITLLIQPPAGQLKKINFHNTKSAAIHAEANYTELPESLFEPVLRDIQMVVDDYEISFTFKSLLDEEEGCFYTIYEQEVD